MGYGQSTLRSAVPEDRQSELIYRSLDHLLAMANNFRSEGCVRQAMEIYWTLSEDHPKTAQALEARESLFELGETFERDEARHTARAVYERLSVT